MENTLLPSRFRFGFDLFAGHDEARIVLPFQRSTVAILIVAAMAIAMTIPAISVFGQAAADWGRLDDLFDLVGALFSTGWLMGWSVGLVILYGLLAVLLFGSESLLLKPGRLEMRLGLPFLFLGVTLDPGKIKNLHHATPKPKSGKAWRGPHLAFDYEGAPLEIGSRLSEVESAQLAARIRALPAATDDFQSQNETDPLVTVMEDIQVETATGNAASNETDAPWTTLPVLALLGANLLPIVGVLMFGWDLGAIMVLFWAESGIIGIYHLLKLAVTRRWLTLLLGPVFVGHFGAFMAVHFLFIYGIFIEGFTGDGPGDSLAEVAQVFVTLWPALLALVLSHGISFFANFPGHDAHRAGNLQDEMSGPYRRIAIMHVTIIIGGGLSLVLGSPLFALILLILLKIVVDLKAHRRQHNRARTT